MSSNNLYLPPHQSAHLNMISSMSLPQLKMLLQSVGAPRAGNKPVLLARAKEWLASPGTSQLVVNYLRTCSPAASSSGTPPLVYSDAFGELLDQMEKNPTHVAPAPAPAAVPPARTYVSAPSFNPSVRRPAPVAASAAAFRPSAGHGTVQRFPETEAQVVILPPIPTGRIMQQESIAGGGLVAHMQVLASSWITSRFVRFDLPLTNNDIADVAPRPDGSSRIFIRFGLMDVSSNELKFPERWPGKCALSIGSATIFDTLNPVVVSSKSTSPRPAIDITDTCVLQFKSLPPNKTSSSSSSSSAMASRTLQVTLKFALISPGNLRWLCSVTRIVYHADRTILNRIVRTNEADGETRAREIVGRMLGNDGMDDEIELVSSTHDMSLRDPLNLLRVKHPVRAQACTHLGCFDLFGFLSLQRAAKVSKFKCPICNGDAALDNLVHDGWFANILAQTPPHVGKVQVDKDAKITVPEDENDGNESDDGSDGDSPISSGMTSVVDVNDSSSDNVTSVVTISSSPAPAPPQPQPRTTTQPPKRMREAPNVVVIDDSDDELFG